MKEIRQTNIARCKSLTFLARVYNCMENIKIVDIKIENFLILINKFSELIYQANSIQLAFLTALIFQIIVLMIFMKLDCGPTPPRCKSPAINATINGKIKSTINGTVNGTINDTVNGTINWFLKFFLEKKETTVRGTYIVLVPFSPLFRPPRGAGGKGGG